MLPQFCNLRFPKTSRIFTFFSLRSLWMHETPFLQNMFACFLFLKILCTRGSEGGGVGNRETELFNCPSLPHFLFFFFFFFSLQNAFFVVDIKTITMGSVLSHFLKRPSFFLLWSGSHKKKHKTREIIPFPPLFFDQMTISSCFGSRDIGASAIGSILPRPPYVVPRPPPSTPPPPPPTPAAPRSSAGV